MTSLSRYALIALGVVAVVFFVNLWLYRYRDSTIQIENYEKLMRIAHELIETRKKTGALPLQLNARDRWGRPVLYVTDGKDFMLVSYGEDGKPDFHEYPLPKLVERSHTHQHVCPPRNGDTILVNGIIVQGCSKQHIEN